MCNTLRLDLYLLNYRNAAALLALPCLCVKHTRAERALQLQLQLQYEVECGVRVYVLRAIYKEPAQIAAASCASLCAALG